MNIHKKIEEIRSKPEHERLRYVWGAVAVSMFFVFLIWILSIKISFQKNQDSPQTAPLPDIGKQLQDIKDATPSLEDVDKIMSPSATNQPAATSSTNMNTPTQPLQ